MTQFLCILCGSIGGGAIGFLLSAVMNTAKETKEVNAPTFYTAKKLQRHTLSVAIFKDRYLDDPVETVERVKKDFAKELYKIVEDNIVSEEDRYSNHIKFYVDIWTKEAADAQKMD